jgi:signal transduction histidine kinase
VKRSEVITAPARADWKKLQRGPLFRKYFLLILALVCGALLISGGIGLYFSYQENKVALASLQREKASSAAARIEQFIRQIEQQVAFAALPQLGVEGVEQRRIEFLKLLRLVPAVTDIAQIDPRGREQLSVSRLKMDEAGKNVDRSSDPAFIGAKPGQTWFGPVYFRKETEPYMSISVRSGGENGQVTVADVNLKFIWDVVTRIKVGQKGKAYVVDATGHLVADPDIGLVLRKTDLSQLDQVKAALKPDADDGLAMLARDHAGKAVLAAHAPIESLGWKVFVEQPVSEVFAALDATILRTILLIVAGLLFSALAAMWLAGSMVRPIRELQEGAQRIGAGELDFDIRIRTGDELEQLANQFNSMTSQLRESYAGLERKVQERTAELQETLEQQTATAEILKVIASTPTDTQPVFDAIIRSALRIFGCKGVGISLRDGDSLRVAAEGGSIAPAVGRSRPLDEGSIGGLSIIKNATIDVPDTEAQDAPGWTQESGRRAGFRAIAAAPLQREGSAIGSIAVMRETPGALSAKQLEILRTFADQAVIAIENVRLFNETKESLEQQTATSEILRVISASTTDTQPVLEAIVKSAAQLFAPCNAFILMREGPLVQLRAMAGATIDEKARDAVTRHYPVLFDPTVSTSARAMVECRMNFCSDTEAPGVPTYIRDAARAGRFRSNTVVPLVREGEGVGTIVVTYPEPGHTLTDKQVALLHTFADQAVIAIENVRLFNETKESLEQQTAISEVLRVISGSPTDVKPVLDAVAIRAARICEAHQARIHLLDDDRIRYVSGSDGHPASRDSTPVHSGTVAGSAVIRREAVHLHDIQGPDGDGFPESQENARKAGHRTILSVPLMRENRARGAITLRRKEVRPFSEKQIALLRTFADQAAIAIENVRLFNETQEALEQQTATAEVLNVISGSITDAHPVFDAISRSCLRLYGARHVGLYVRAGDSIERVGYALAENAAEDGSQQLWPIPLDDKSLSGRCILTGELVHIKDAESEEGLSDQSRAIIQATAARSVLLAPMNSMGSAIGALSIARRAPGGFSEREVELIRTFADQAVIAMENVRLFREIEDKSAQLEVANKHKSEFLANMSHELRTPLNAIIGFSEVLSERMFGELNEKQADYMKDIHESGRHLLSLINDILDLSKIEAGRMDLEVSSFHVPTALSNAMTLVRERAQRHGIALGLDVDERVGDFQADERKFKQIVLNLLSNAVKFTPDGGRVDVRAKMNGSAMEVAVRDTGIGIAPEDQAAVFEEFKQVGRDYTRKAEGTGLGLALTKRFIELHGGQIRLESVPGQGSTFSFTLPIRH